MQDEDLANVMRALGHPVRLSILRILAEKQASACCCTDVTQCLPLAQSTVYDARLVRQVSTPTAEMLSVSVPTTVLRGEQTFPLLVTAADRLSSEIEGAELVIAPESVMHRPDPAATARVVRERLA